MNLGTSRCFALHVRFNVCINYLGCILEASFRRVRFFIVLVFEQFTNIFSSS